MPTVSPNKTVEGFLGGIIFAIITAYLCFQFLWIEWNTYDIKDAISIALIVSIVGTIGDLIESKIKRLAEVKDSGSIFPGHGGV
ncbi:MAG: phosphatidate cytidylyltransferase, partial [Bacteroidia bacterium]|nr:phosphatidate cytidylyltransferase [Bacteroidia bacterium]